MTTHEELKADALRREKEAKESSAKAAYLQASINYLIKPVGDHNAAKTAKAAISKAERAMRNLFGASAGQTMLDLSVQAVKQCRKVEVAQ